MPALVNGVQNKCGVFLGKYRLDESFLLEQLMRSMGESVESHDSVPRGETTVEDFENLLAQLAIQVHAYSVTSKNVVSGTSLF